jgi:hypothetical protein
MGHVHRISLRAGWLTTLIGPDEVRHVRRFGSPPALDPAEAVFLTCDRLPAPALVALNGVLITAAVGRLEVDITALLAPRNELCIDTAAGVEIGEVAVEFRS